MTVETHAKLEECTTRELETLITLCIGKIFRIGSRPEQPEDALEFDNCKYLSIAAREVLDERIEAQQ